MKEPKANINIREMTTNNLQDNIDTICSRFKEVKHYDSLKKLYMKELLDREPFKSLVSMIALVDSRIDKLEDSIDRLKV